MMLDDLLHELRERHVILLLTRAGRVSLWSPNTRVPAAIRAAVRCYDDELTVMIAESDVLVCPSPMWHRPYFSYKDGTFICEACERLLPEMYKAS
jgi:hypothetical protein